MPALILIHQLSAPFATFPTGNNYRCLRCLRGFLFPLNEGDLTGKYVLAQDGLRNMIWRYAVGDPEVPAGMHCEAVDNYTKADLQPAVASREEAYIVETDSPNCDGCGLGARYRVVGPNKSGSGDIAESTIYERQEDADDLAEAMNRAYRAGVRMLMRNMSTGALDEMRDFAAAR